MTRAEAMAEAREALSAYRANSTRHYIDEAMEGLLAALDQAPPAAVPDREAVAIAICEAFTTPKGVLWWATDDETRQKFRIEADAAIKVMQATKGVE